MSGFWGVLKDLAPSLITGASNLLGNEAKSDQSREVTELKIQGEKELAAQQQQFWQEQFNQQAALEARLAAIQNKFAPVKNEFDALGAAELQVRAADGGGQLKQGSIQNAMQGLLQAYNLRGR